MNSDTSANSSAPVDEPKKEGEEQESSAAKEAQDNSGQDPALARMAELEAKLQETEKKYLYLYSEFENFRRRNERDRLDFLKFGHESFLKELLQVVDNFERAIAHAKSFSAEKGGPLTQVLQGVEMIHFQFLEALKGQGVTPVVAVGAKFDPAVHEAVGEEKAEGEPGIVLKEMQKGYLLHNRLLRAAKVIVAK